jgi:hypothetical protein
MNRALTRITLTPSPSPIRWERVARRKWLMVLLRVHSSSGVTWNQSLVFFENSLILEASSLEASAGFTLLSKRMSFRFTGPS